MHTSKISGHFTDLQERFSIVYHNACNRRPEIKKIKDNPIEPAPFPTMKIWQYVNDV